ncbi:hypothetical protein RJ639_041779 [Escallonia herrerae]|uniref:Uncharacterized protein n=1 Tax=Escallonia herrerae TaxID=1293975 RepID=A0AA88WG40_9ASTE|nr:hypothetical protein RJ639_041779 [Escallonia herrerae]
MGPGEEAAPKLVRLLYFVGAGFICTAAINKWRELERKSVLQQQAQLSENPSNAAMVSMGSGDPISYI